MKLLRLFLILATLFGGGFFLGKKHEGANDAWPLFHPEGGINRILLNEYQALLMNAEGYALVASSRNGVSCEFINFVSNGARLTNVFISNNRTVGRSSHFISAKDAAEFSELIRLSNFWEAEENKKDFGIDDLVMRLHGWDQGRTRSTLIDGMDPIPLWFFYSSMSHDQKALIIQHGIRRNGEPKSQPKVNPTSQPKHGEDQHAKQ